MNDIKENSHESKNNTNCRHNYNYGPCLFIFPIGCACVYGSSILQVLNEYVRHYTQNAATGIELEFQNTAHILVDYFVFLNCHGKCNLRNAFRMLLCLLSCRRPEYCFRRQIH